MTGTRQEHRGAVDARGPSWLRLGVLLAVGEVIVLVLVVLHPGGALGANPARNHLATSVGHTGHDPGRSQAGTSAPTTTVPLSPPATVAQAPAPPTTIASGTPTPTIAAPVVDAPGILPANIVPQPDFLQSCTGSQYDDSLPCVAATLQAIANGRSHEGLPPMVLPTNWSQLSPDQQIFVATNLERTSRGLAPLTAMATSLDQAARAGAAQNIDPGPPRGFPFSEWGSNWAGAVGSPLEAIYFWMYDDGAGSANIDCTPSDPAGCWGHRENMLLRLPCRECLMGTGWDAGGYKGDPSITELLVETSGSPAVDFTWRQESAYLP
ncbi:MAG TPA: hypothetical protein VII76_14405 [Acidimicrobiales bacterium]